MHERDAHQTSQPENEGINDYFFGKTVATVRAIDKMLGHSGSVDSARYKAILGNVQMLPLIPDSLELAAEFEEKSRLLGSLGYANIPLERDDYSGLADLFVDSLGELGIDVQNPTMLRVGFATSSGQAGCAIPFLPRRIREGISPQFVAYQVALIDLQSMQNVRVLRQGSGAFEAVLANGAFRVARLDDPESQRILLGDFSEFLDHVVDVQRAKIVPSSHQLP